jgi:hypothetical protein
VIADDNKPTCYSTFDLNYKSSSSETINPENIDICKDLQNTQPKTAMEYTWQCMEKSIIIQLSIDITLYPKGALLDQISMSMHLCA